MSLPLTVFERLPAERRPDVMGGARGHRAGEQPGKIGVPHLPLLAATDHHPRLVVGHELERDVRFRFAPTDQLSGPDEPGLALVEEELARRHADPLFFDISHSAGSGRPSTLQSSTLSRTWTDPPRAVQLLTCAPPRAPVVSARSITFRTDHHFPDRTTTGANSCTP